MKKIFSLLTQIIMLINTVVILFMSDLLYAQVSNDTSPAGTFSIGYGISPVGTLTSITGSMTLTAPNGGENWTIGTSQNVRWSSTAVANVKLEYTTDNGTNWTEIISSVAA